MVVDYKNRRLFELVEGRDGGRAGHIAGREKVRHVVLDKRDPYRSFARRLFPKTVLVAAKFHVLGCYPRPSIGTVASSKVTGDQRRGDAYCCAAVTVSSTWIAWPSTSGW